MPIYVAIRNIHSDALRQIYVKDVPVLANFDPFGKYIMIMSNKNVL